MSEACEQAETKVPAKEVLAVAVVYLTILAVGYFNVVFLGKSLVYSDNLNPFDFRFLEQNYGPHFVPGTVWSRKNLKLWANFHDPGATWWQGEPAAEFLRTGIREHELPFWDPFVAAGAPALANFNASCAFPPSLLVALAGNTSGLRNAEFLAMLLAAGLFTYLFLRKHDLSVEASFFGGLVFMFSGAIAQNVGSFLGQTLECLPFLLFFTRRFFDRPTWGRSLALAGTVAVTLLTSSPPLLVGVFTSFLVYGGACSFGRRARLQPGGSGPTIARFGAALAVGFALVGFCYFPFFAVLRAIPNVMQLRIYQHAALGRVPPDAFFQLISPALWGGSKIFAVPPLKVTPGPEIPYVGFVPVLLALLAGTTRSGNGRTLLWTFAAGTLVLTLKLLGIEPVQSLGRLPIARHIHVAVYFGFFYGFLIAVLGAFGLDRIRGCRLSRIRALVPIALLALALAGLRRRAVLRGVLRSPYVYFWEHRWKILIAISCLAALAVFFGSIARDRRVARLWTLGILLIATAEGISNTWYPRQNRWDVYRHPVPYVLELQKRPRFYRSLGTYMLPANAGSALEFFQIDSLYMFNPGRIFEYYHRYFGGTPGTFLTGCHELPSERILDQANVRYLVLREDLPSVTQEVERRSYRVDLRDGFILLCERPSQPRYFFTSEYRVSSPDRALELAGTSDLPRKEIVLESPVSASNTANRLDDPDVEIENFRRNSYTLHVRAPRAGLVYCSESFFEGWSATVNGSPARILPANYAFRAVEVPPGRVTIRFSYWPPGLTAGIAVSAAAVVVAAGMGLATRSCRSMAEREKRGERERA